MKRKVRAFTIMEMLVGMAITSIVAVSAWQAWDFVAQQNISYRKQNNAVKELRSLDVLLARDFDGASAAVKTENSLELRFEKKKINYQFNSSQVLRCDENGCDTFHVSHSSPEFSLAAMPDSSSLKMVESIRFTARCNNAPVSCYYSKIYAAADLIGEHNSEQNR